jgi:2'-5' RNA ligase
VTGPATLSPQDEDWIRFRDLSSMVDHWERPGWTPGRQAYYWYLTFDSSDLERLAKDCQDHLRLPYLDPVPLDELHLTLPRVGWSDEISAEVANAVADAAATTCARMRPFMLSVGPLAGSAGAVRLSVGPWEPVMALYDTLRRAIRAVRGGASDEGEFRPHIGVAYSNRAIPTDSLVSAISPLRELPTVDVAVTKADLVLLRRRGRTYTWSTVRSLSLGDDQPQEDVP